MIEDCIEEANSTLPIILTAHASIEGAKFGGERLVMLGNDLPFGSLVKNPKFSYVAMGHIHKPQDVNEGNQPPVIYPGSIERVDFGEAKEKIASLSLLTSKKVKKRRLSGVNSKG